MGERRWVHLDVAEVARVTEKAMLLVLEDGEEVWVPKSHVSDADEYRQGMVNCTVSVTDWIAEQKGIA